MEFEVNEKEIASVVQQLEQLGLKKDAQLLRRDLARAKAMTPLAWRVHRASEKLMQLCQDSGPGLTPTKFRFDGVILLLRRTVQHSADLARKGEEADGRLIELMEIVEAIENGNVAGLESLVTRNGKARHHHRQR